MVICEFFDNLFTENDVTGRIVYGMFFLGRNFVQSSYAKT